MTDPVTGVLQNGIEPLDDSRGTGLFLQGHAVAEMYPGLAGIAALGGFHIQMELVFTGARKYRFAIECKWRKEFRDGKIDWARNDQICVYRMFQDQVRIPVFVAIGIGGEPDSPEKLFLTPLNNIHMHNELYEAGLIPFKRKPTHKFYYDVKQLKLF